MTPTEITNNQDLYDSFLVSIKVAYSDFLSNYAKNTQMFGRDKNKKDEIKLVLANAYFEVLMDYMTPTSDTDENFFTIDEIKEIELRLNKLFSTNYTYFNN